MLIQRILAQKCVHILNSAFKGNIKHIKYYVYNDIDILPSGYTTDLLEGRMLLVFIFES
jgi:hypothetical protein